MSYYGYPGNVQPGTTLRAIDVGDEAVYAYPHSAIWVIWVLALCVDGLMG